MFIHMHVAILLNHLSSSSSLSWSPWSSSSSSSSSSSPSRSPCLLILAHPCFHVPLHCLQVCVLEIALRISERPQSRASFAKLVLKRKALSKSEFWPPAQRCQRQSLRRRMLYHSLNFQCQARWRMPHWGGRCFLKSCCRLLGRRPSVKPQIKGKLGVSWILLNFGEAPSLLCLQAIDQTRILSMQSLSEDQGFFIQELQASPPWWWKECAMPGCFLGGEGQVLLCKSWHYQIIRCCSKGPKCY